MRTKNKFIVVCVCTLLLSSKYLISTTTKPMVGSPAIGAFGTCEHHTCELITMDDEPRIEIKLYRLNNIHL